MSKLNQPMASATARICNLALPAFALTCLVLASGCASKSYIALLEQDGKTGRVIATQAGRTAQLDQAGAALALKADGPVPLKVTTEQIETDFGAALKAQPKAPETFILYFNGTSTSLTPESSARIAEIRSSVSARPAPDVSIIGHTDRAGDDMRNEALGLERARVVRDLLATQLNQAVEVTVSSHGERNPLVPTADGVAEARNRRVELTIR